MYVFAHEDAAKQKVKSRKSKKNKKKKKPNHLHDSIFFFFGFVVFFFFLICLDLLCVAFCVLSLWLLGFFGFSPSIVRLNSMALIVCLVFHKSDIAVTKDVYRILHYTVYTRIKYMRLFL